MAGLSVGRGPQTANSKPADPYNVAAPAKVYVDPAGMVWDYVEPTAGTVRNPDGSAAVSQGRWVPRQAQPGSVYDGGRVTAGAAPPAEDSGASLASIQALWNQAKSMAPNLPKVQKPSMASYEAAQAAEYGKAKDQIGRNGEAAMRSLRNVMQSRGISGSGIEAEGSANILGQMTSGLGQTSRDQATQRLGRLNAIDDMGYQGDITQRGQDLTAHQGALGLMPTLLNYFRSSSRAY